MSLLSCQCIVSPEEATMVNETVELCLGAKETKRCFDYRCALIMVTNRVIGKICQGAQMLLQTVFEIQSIAYSRDESRSPRSILRFHNLTWLHVFICWEVIGYHTKQMSCGAYQSENTLPKQQAHISKLAKSLPSLGNTVVPFSTITSRSSSWQAHLERIKRLFGCRQKCLVDKQ